MVFPLRRRVVDKKMGARRYLLVLHFLVFTPSVVHSPMADTPAADSAACSMARSSAAAAG
jgi:hypothetical protein